METTKATTINFEIVARVFLHPPTKVQNDHTANILPPGRV